MHDTSLLHSGNHEHVHHGKNGFHDGVYAACDAAVSSALCPQTEERVSCAGGGRLPDDACVKANGTCIFNGGRWNGGALYPAHETAEISAEGKFSSVLYLYDPDVASHLVPDMAAYGTSADIRV